MRTVGGVPARQTPRLAEQAVTGARFPWRLCSARRGLTFRRRLEALAIQSIHHHQHHMQGKCLLSTDTLCRFFVKLCL